MGLSLKSLLMITTMNLTCTMLPTTMYPFLWVSGTVQP